MPRQRESPRATFPFTINTLLSRAAVDARMKNEAHLGFHDGASASSSLFGSFDFDRSQPCAAHRRGHRRAARSLSVKLGSYPAWSLRGSKSRQPTSADFVRRLVVCKASPSPSTDPKRSAARRRSAHATLRSGTRASRRKFVSLSSSTSGFVCVRPPTETTTHRLRSSDYFSRLTKCLVLSREISDPTLRDEGR